MSKSIRLVINNQSHDMAIKEYQRQRVVTLGDIDELHQRPENTAARNFSTNRDKFIEGTDKVDPIVKTRFRLDLSYCCSPSLIGLDAAATTATLVVVVVIGNGGPGGNPCAQRGLCG